MPWRKEWQPTPVFLPGESHGRRGLVGCSPWGHSELDTTERLHFQFSLSCIGERNGNPLQCSCLENPMDGGAWWATVCGVAKSQTRLSNQHTHTHTHTHTHIGHQILLFIHSKSFRTFHFLGTQFCQRDTKKSKTGPLASRML